MKRYVFEIDAVKICDNSCSDIDLIPLGAGLTNGEELYIDFENPLSTYNLDNLKNQMQDQSYKFVREEDV